MSEMWKTPQEINAQPEIWRQWAGPLEHQAEAIRRWIHDLGITRVWFTGAGTSAFIGDTIAQSLSARRGEPSFRSIATTDLVSSPELYFGSADQDLVVVSFGRSGNSSETLGTLSLLDRMAPAAQRLNITCNAESALAKQDHPDPDRLRTIVLPEQCHDYGFAMTSSFTTMVLTALACFDHEPETGLRLAQLADCARKHLDEELDLERPGRCVFLGSGPFVGIARESALKVLELTAGRTTAFWDSSLGFRHGPKAVLNPDTTVFVFLSNNTLSRRYDEDIASEIESQSPDVDVVRIGCPMSGFSKPDIVIGSTADDVWNAPLFVLPAQRLAVAWSLDIGLAVDDPFRDAGNLSRVVSNVQLYT